MTQPPVTVEHGGLTITTNTATEADLRAELARDTPTGETSATDAPATSPAPPDSSPAPARDAQGRFVKPPAAAPAEPSAAPVEPADPPAQASSDAPPQRRKDDTPRHHPIARMNQALAQKAEAERRAAALEAELAQYRRATPAPAGNGHAPAAPPAARTDDEPQFEAFAQQPDPYTAYLQAWTRWDNRQQIDARVAQLQQQQAAQAREATFTARLAEGRKAHPDFDQVLTTADTLGLQVSAVMREAITDADHPADVVHYLAAHPEECTQLAAQTQHMVVSRDAADLMRQLLESRLAPRAAASTGAGTAARAAVSTAKPPVTPVGSSPVVSDEPPGESASAAEHARYWNRRLKVPGALK